MKHRPTAQDKKNNAAFIAALRNTANAGPIAGDRKPEIIGNTEEERMSEQKQDPQSSIVVDPNFSEALYLIRTGGFEADADMETLERIEKAGTLEQLKEATKNQRYLELNGDEQTQED